MKIIKKELKAVLTRHQGTANPEGHGKLDPNQDDPFIIAKVLGNSAYHFQDIKGRDILRSWNIVKLKKYNF